MITADLQQPHDDLAVILSSVDDIAALPQSIYKILELSGSETAGTSELESAIMIDPGFSAKLLSVANSAYYCLPKVVTSIKEAILYLGFKSIRQMAMTVGFFDLFVGKTDRESLRRRTWWRTSIDTAIISRFLAKELKINLADEAYTAGLLHLLGKTILDRSRPGSYDKVEDLIKDGYRGFAAEREIFGCSHVEVSAGACQKWGLPTIIIDSLNYLEPSLEEDVSEESLRIRALVALGHVSSHAAAEGVHFEHIPIWALRTLGLDEGEGVLWVEKGIEYLTSHGKPSLA